MKLKMKWVIFGVFLCAAMVTASLIVPPKGPLHLLFRLKVIGWDGTTKTAFYALASDSRSQGNSVDFFCEILPHLKIGGGEAYSVIIAMGDKADEINDNLKKRIDYEQCEQCEYWCSLMDVYIRNGYSF